MGFKKKTHEELVKQINIKTDFADKAFKKMRAERYGITYCCPFDLDKIVIKNELCGWDDKTIPVLPEAYDRAMLSDPNLTSCTPPGIYNPQTGLCEASSSATQVGSISFEYADAESAGTPTEVEPATNYSFGRDCPILLQSISGTQNGAGGVPTQIGQGFTGNPSWWLTYDATATAGVNDISFVNALAKGPTGGWPGSTTLSFSVPITVSTTKRYYVFLSGDNGFGITLNGTVLIDPELVYDGGSMAGLAGNINQANGLPTNASQGDLATQASEKSCNQRYIAQGLGSAGYTRGYIYPVTIPAGCNTLTLSNYNAGGPGMFAFAIFDNTDVEIINSTQRSDLTEIAASDTITNFYTNVPVNTPWTCTPPAVLQPGSGNACPQCVTEINTISYECPPGYTLGPGDPPTCVFDPQPPCDTETLLINVVNQNGDIMSNYNIIFDGGTYTTDESGNITIVIEDASVNTLHTFNLCECFTTSGGCAIQQVDIVVTEPDLETCSTDKPLCNCVAPSFVSEVFSSPNMSITFTDANYATGNDVTAETYTIYWRLVNQATWNVISGLTMSSSGTIFYNFLALAPGHYEYKIKSICVDEESNWSATNNFTIPEKPVNRKGCIDINADNYDNLATIDDGSCTYTVYGCTDVTANNYYGTVPSNTTLIDDGSCTYGCLSCADFNSNTSVPVCCGPTQQYYISSAFRGGGLWVSVG